jgi:hypothetical protein
MILIRAQARIQDDTGDRTLKDIIVTGYVCTQYGEVKAVCIVDDKLHAVHLDEIFEVSADV